ncbi:RIP homotypic interaction motif [Achromobacter xylosoxidans]|uniref:RIP homotypic interaction motif-containing protein n=1 Tax=Alcaligenes xylosoxydans xylosoxydans TaxID=85698 RepID=UPI0006C2FE4A|nr:RIP homotypic interaction motif-containing protein [Achromobacter xylosoxidans]CUI38023.1 RIP homotypic interaction motif [Achromobacter xylosoxidans]
MHDTNNAKVYVRSLSGERTGPFYGAFTGKRLVVFDKKFDATEGDYISRELPSGREESYLVKLATYMEGLDDPFWKLDLEKTTALPARTEPKTTTINIHNSAGIQVGDHNTMSFRLAINEMVERIEGSNASSEEKAEAKSRLQKFLEHPLVVSIAGGLISSSV